MIVLKRFAAFFIACILMLSGCSSQKEAPASSDSDNVSSNPAIITNRQGEIDESLIEKAMEYANNNIENRPSENICYVKIVCEKALESGMLSDAMLSILPDDGIILSEYTIDFSSGDTAFDAFLIAIKDNSIHMEYKGSNKAPYIQGIDNLYEFDCGPLSGWMYRVNGWLPTFGMGQYKILPGDTVEIVYTCDIGRDLGNESYTME